MISETLRVNQKFKWFYEYIDDKKRGGESNTRNCFEPFHAFLFILLGILSHTSIRNVSKVNCLQILLSASWKTSSYKF